MEYLGPIYTVIMKIVEAAGTADDNKERCKQLAGRVRALGVALHVDTSRTAAGGAVTQLVRAEPLKRLKDTLEEALRLVKSCRRRQSDFGAWVVDILTADATATKLQDIMTRINECLFDLLYVEVVAIAAPVQQPPSLQRSIKQSAQPSLKSLVPVQAPSLRQVSKAWSAQEQAQAVSKAWSAQARAQAQAQAVSKAFAQAQTRARARAQLQDESAWSMINHPAQSSASPQRQSFVKERRREQSLLPAQSPQFPMEHVAQQLKVATRGRAMIRP